MELNLPASYQLTVFSFLQLTEIA